MREDETEDQVVLSSGRGAALTTEEQRAVHPTHRHPPPAPRTLHELHARARGAGKGEEEEAGESGGGRGACGELLGVGVRRQKSLLVVLQKMNRR